MPPLLRRRRVAVAVLTCATSFAGLPILAAHSDVPSGTVADQVVGLAGDVKTYVLQTTNGDAVSLAAGSVAGGARITTSVLTVEFAPPTGLQFATGQDYDASTTFGGTRAVVSVTGQPGVTQSCAHVALHVQHVDYDGSGNVVDLAAEYRSMCSSTGYQWGEVEYGVSVPFGFVDALPLHPGAMADTAPGTTRSKTLTLVNRGTADVQLGTPSFRGLSTSFFALANDTCVNATIAAGGACTVDVTFTPQQTSPYTATLVYGADTFAPETTVQLSGRGAAAPAAPSVATLAGDDGVAVVITPPTPDSTHATVTGYDIYRDDNAAQPIHSQTDSAAWVDHFPGGATHSYYAVANSAVGPSAASATASGASLSPVATSGSISAYTTDLTTAAGDTASYLDTPTLGAVALGSVTFVGSNPNATLTVGTTLNGQRLVPGTYTAPNVPGITSSWNFDSCPTSLVHVTDADIRADGTPDVLSGDYTLACDDGTKLSGVFRWHSSASYAAAAVSPLPGDAGPVVLSTIGPVPTITVTATGTSQLNLGQASLSGPNAGDFAVTNDSCSSAVVPAGASCSVSLSFSPSAAHARSAVLTFADNTTAGERRIPLAGSGAVVASAPQNPFTVPGAGHAFLSWVPPVDNGGASISGYQIFRGPSADALSPTPVATLGAVTSWIDRTVVAGTTYFYGIAAVNVAGVGPVVTSQPMKGLASELVYSQWTGTHYDLLAGDATGASAATLSDGASDTEESAVSPDGKQVAFVKDAGASTTIWVVPSDGSAPARQLTHGTTDEYPAWSPDGTHIAFDFENAGVFYVATVPAAGGEPNPVAGASNAYRPSYTPSGRELVVGDEANGGVDVIGLDGSGRRTVAGTAKGVDPQVSPDGTKIVFATFDQTLKDACGISYPVGRVLVVPTIGGTPTTLLAGTNNNYFTPSWSPDSTTLAVSHVVLASDGCIDHSVIDQVASTTGALLHVISGDASDGSFHFAVTPKRPVTRPATPSALMAALAHGTVTLHWTNPADKDLWKIVVRRGAAGGAAPTSLSAGVGVPVSGTSAKATGLTDGKSYAFSVFAIDTAGTLSSRVSRSAVPMPPPVIRSLLTPSGLPFTVTWRVAAAASYDVRYAKGTGSWRNWKSATTAYSAVFGAHRKPVTLTAGSKWSFTARAHDRYGNLTGWAVRKTLKAG